MAKKENAPKKTPAKKVGNKSESTPAKASGALKVEELTKEITGTGSKVVKTILAASGHELNRTTAMSIVTSMAKIPAKLLNAAKKLLSNPEVAKPAVEQAVRQPEISYGKGKE